MANDKVHRQQLGRLPSGLLRGCAGKIGFPSKRNASAIARGLADGLAPYKCRLCQRWHVGHTIRSTDSAAHAAARVAASDRRARRRTRQRKGRTHGPTE